MERKARHIDPEELVDANRDYVDRIEREGVYVVYDSVLDALFVEFGGPREALSEHVADNIMLRIHPETLHVVGLEITDFLTDFLPNNRLFRSLTQELEIQEGQDRQITLMEPKHKATRETLEALIPSLVQAVGAGA